MVDVRRDDDFADADRPAAPAFHRSPDEVVNWRGDFPGERPVVATAFATDPRAAIQEHGAINPTKEN
jgi:hypothetical protein